MGLRYRRAQFACQQQQVQVQPGGGAPSVLTQGAQECGRLVHAQERIVSHWRFGDRHDVQIACRVTGQAFFHHGVAQQLVEPGAAFFSRGQGIAALNLAQHFHQVLARNLEDRQLANPRQHVLGKNTVDLRQRALPPSL